MRTLTSAQKRLLEEIRTAGTLYITRYTHWYRTAEALRNRGLVVVSEPDYSRIAKDGYSVIDAEPTEWVRVADDELDAALNDKA